METMNNQLIHNTWVNRTLICHGIELGFMKDPNSISHRTAGTPGFSTWCIPLEYPMGFLNKLRRIIHARFFCPMLLLSKEISLIHKLLIKLIIGQNKEQPCDNHPWSWCILFGLIQQYQALFLGQVKGWYYLPHQH